MEWKKINKLIPTELKEEFKNNIFKIVQQFDKKHQLNIMEQLEKMEDIKENKKSKEYLKEKLQTKIKHIEYEEEKYEDTIEYCKNTLNHLDSKDKENKIIYYKLGEALFKIGETYNTKQEFIEDMEEKLLRKRTIIYTYISFYKLCQRFKDIIDCDLTFREIINNIKSIYLIKS